MATFPVLSTGDILVSLADIGLPFTADDVDRPSPSRVIRAYLWFWNHITSLTHDEVRMAGDLWLEGLSDDAAANANGSASADVDMLGETVHLGVLLQTL